MHYDNTPTVVVCIVRVDDGLLLVRRADTNKLALPGGFHMKGESWQEAGAREVLEETGLTIDPNWLKVKNVHTSNDKNLLFAEYSIRTDGVEFKPQLEEVTEVVIAKKIPEKDDVSFPLHYQYIYEAFYL